MQLKMMYHFRLDEIKHYLDFKGRFSYMIEKIEFNHSYLKLVLFFCICIPLIRNIGIEHSKL